MCDLQERSCLYQPNWLALDDLIMEKIFEQLPLSDRFSASLVCHRWSDCFELAKVWQTIDISDAWPPAIPTTESVKADNNHECSTQSLDYDRTTNCLQRIGPLIRTVFIQPSQQFVKLYQFFVLLEWYFTKQAHQNASVSDAHCNNIRRLYFEFPCDRPINEDANGIKLFGVGGQLIGSFKKLLLTLKNLCDLTLVDLVLVRYEANSLMDLIGMHMSRTLKLLSCINLTTNHCSIHQIGMLYNLQILKISPQNIDDLMLQALVDTNLMHLYIIQNGNTPKAVMPCSEKAWINFKRMMTNSEHPKIHLSAADCDLLIQPEAPVYSIARKNMKINSNVMTKIIDNYNNVLVSYSDEGLSVCDTDMIDIVSKCQNLKFLTILRPITTGALLTLVAIGKNLQEIRVKKSDAIRKCDAWILEFSQNNHLNTQWLQENFDSWDRIACAISNDLSKPWHFLNE